MAKLLTVFGATGQQGGSVVDNLLADHELSSGQALQKKGVEVVAVDFDDAASIAAAVDGASAVFAYTTSSALALSYPSLSSIATLTKLQQ
jgi:uncharacterized protein YbjT (DUF2867 family)